MTTHTGQPYNTRRELPALLAGRRISVEELKDRVKSGEITLRQAHDAIHPSLWARIKAWWGR